MNFIRYNLSTESYSFNHLSTVEYESLTAEEKVQYLEQKMIWALDEDPDRLEALMLEAKQKSMEALGKECY